MRFRSSKLFAAVFVLAIGGGAGLVVFPRAEPEPVLHLVEESARVLPDSFEIGGANVSGTTTVYWAVNRSTLLLERDGELKAVQPDSLVRPVAARLSRDGTMIEVIDAERRSLVRSDLAGRFAAEQPLQLPWRVESAVPFDSLWVLGGRDVAGNYRVVALQPSGARTRLLTLRARDYPGQRLTMAVSEADGRAFATLQNSPFTVFQVLPATSLGLDSASGRFAVPALPQASGREPPLWASLGVHRLDNGYVRTFSDLRSDRRVVVTYDANGKLLRDRQVRVPMAVLATDPVKRMLLVARRTDRFELVRYKWRWAGANH
jgi:hypothetical protein